MKPVHKPTLLCFFLVAATYVLYQSIFSPYHNWDMIMYVASAKSYGEPDIDVLQQTTYDAVRHSVSKERYESLTKENNYRQVVHTDSSAFKENLPFYQIRFIYTGAIYLFAKAGIDIVFATHIISGLAIFFALVLLYLASSSLLGNTFAYSVPFLAIMFGAADIAAFSTPDGLAFLAVMLASYLYMQKRIIPLLFFLPVMVCVRTDLVLFVLPLLFFILVAEKPYRKQTALTMLAVIIFYTVTNAYWQNPGWITTFYFTFIQALTHPLSMPSPLTLEHYFMILEEWGIKQIPFNTSLILFSLVIGYSFYLIAHRIKNGSLSALFSSPPAILSIVCMIVVIGRFLLFPAMHHRFVGVYYLVATFALLAMITDNIKASR